jgi:hypothetical protein
MKHENEYYEKTSREMRKDINKFIDEINTNVIENESNHAVVLSRLDSICSLLQITLLHIQNLNNLNKCATTNEEAENAEEATAEKTKLT